MNSGESGFKMWHIRASASGIAYVEGRYAGIAVDQFERLPADTAHDQLVQTMQHVRLRAEELFRTITKNEPSFSSSSMELKVPV